MADESSLIAAAQHGDARLFGLVLSRYERQLYASAYSLVGSSWDAWDAVQETYMEACANIGALRDAGKFKAWLSTILVRKCYDCLNRRRKDVPVDEVPERASHTFDGTEHDARLLQAVRLLGDDQRLAVALRFFLDLSLPEIAVATGWPLGTVKSRIHRAMSRLRLLLQDEMNAEVSG